MSLYFKNTKIYYSDNSKIILNIKEFKINIGLNFLTGKNGSGKSTLLKFLSNYFNDEINYQGTVLIDNMPLSNFHIGMVTQNPLDSINTELSFIENIILAKTNHFAHISLKKQLTRKSRNEVIAFLKSFKNSKFLLELVNKQSSKLSSGQQQMLAILMRIVRFQKILLLDECTANLDFENTKIIMDIITELIESGTIVIFATHQSELLNINNSKLYILENGTIKEKQNG